MARATLPVLQCPPMKGFEQGGEERALDAVSAAAMPASGPGA
jgi:hypothetical protein